MITHVVGIRTAAAAAASTNIQLQLVSLASRLPCRSTVIRRGRQWFSSAQAKKTNKAANSTAIAIHQETITSGTWQLPVTIHSHSTAKNLEVEQCPILLISGWTGIASDWGVIPKLLSAHTKQDVITYDPRWLGNSVLLPSSSNNDHETSKEDEITWDAMTQDALTILRSLQQHRYEKSTPFCIVGASMGGIVAQQMLQNQDDEMRVDIQSMVLISTTLLRNKKYPISHDFLNLFCTSGDTTASEKGDISREAATQFFESLGTDFLAKPGRARLRDRLVDAFMSRSGIGIEKQRRLLMTASEDAASTTSNDTKFLQPPTLVLHGKQDQVIDYRSAFALQDKFGSKCHVQLFETSDHLLWITDGMRLLDEVGSFVLTHSKDKKGQ